MSTVTVVIDDTSDADTSRAGTSHADTSHADTSNSHADTSHADTSHADTSHAGAGSGRTNGRTKKPGWWWKMRRERMRKQAVVQEVPSGAYIEELPDDAIVTEGTVVSGTQEGTSASAEDPSQKRIRNQRKNNGRRNKKRVKDHTPVLPEPTDTFITDGVEEEEYPSTDEPVHKFFAQYEGFVYRPSVEPNQEFNRLGRMLNWERGDPQRSAAWRQLASAMASQFEGRYGSDANDLSAWQRLCARIGITPIPNELEEAKEAVFNTHVNLVDLTTLPINQEIAIFENEQALSRYTRGGGRIFPRSQAVTEGTLLFSLLRRIDHPPPPGSRRDSRNRVIHPNH